MPALPSMVSFPPPAQRRSSPPSPWIWSCPSPPECLARPLPRGCRCRPHRRSSRCPLRWWPKLNCSTTPADSDPAEAGTGGRGRGVLTVRPSATCSVACSPSTSTRAYRRHTVSIPIDQPSFGLLRTPARRSGPHPEVERARSGGRRTCAFAWLTPHPTTPSHRADRRRKCRCESESSVLCATAGIPCTRRRAAPVRAHPASIARCGPQRHPIESPSVSARTGTESPRLSTVVPARPAETPA